VVQKRKMYHEVVKPTKDPKEDNLFAYNVYRVFYVRCCVQHGVRTAHLTVYILSSIAT
jgi:hypothetical protein